MFIISCVISITLLIQTGYGGDVYNIGVGIADVTGPVAGITLMGYGSMEQQGTGVHLRQWSRAFILETNNYRVVFVTVDCAMMSDGVRIKVVNELRRKYAEDVFTLDNVMISATHTHSGVGGYLMHTLFDLPSFGFSQQTFDAMVFGIVKSVEMAYKRMEKGHIYVKKGRVDGANINRSPTAYMANPSHERDRYSDDVDKELVQVQLYSKDARPLGVINWFAVHATSMNNTNTLVSSDNMGYAAILFEQKINSGKLLGKGRFVAGFASSNLGDVSPNVLDPLCHPSGDACRSDSSCQRTQDSCFAQGPGADMFESTSIIAHTIFKTAWKMWSSGVGNIVSGDVASVHQYVDMPNATVTQHDPTTNITHSLGGCLPAMGYSFAAGTIDGPFATSIVQQGRNTSMPLVDTIRNIFLARPSQQDVDCHAPKPILLFTGGMTYPFDWQPRVVSTQLALVGQLALICVPGEFTTMSGRRMREAVASAIPKHTIPIIVGLCNSYSDYITTYEEYQMQRFEAAANLYGPHTLSIHVHQYKQLADALLMGRKLKRGPEPFGMTEAKMSVVPGVVLDTPGWGWKFGQVVQQPDYHIVHAGQVATVVFVSAHPRNNLKLDDTYCTVEMLIGYKRWAVVHTDADWQTRFHWKRSWWLAGTSTATVEYFVPDSAAAGIYRIRHFGHYKHFTGEIIPYDGTSAHFTVDILGWLRPILINVEKSFDGLGQSNNTKSNN